jgi:spore germination protein KB
VKQKINGKQMTATIVMFLTGSSLITGAYTAAGRDTWLCGIFAFFLVIPMMLVHSAILNLYPGRNYYANILTACGKWAGRAAALYLFLCSMFLVSLVLRDFCEFIHIVNMVETPVPVIAACILGVAIYLLKKGAYVLARVSRFALPFLLISIALTCVLAIKDMEFSNLLPILQAGPEKLAEGTAMIFFLPMGEITACSSLFKWMDPKEKVFPVFFRGVLGALLFLLAANLRNLLVLGNSIAAFLYPSYEAVSVVAIGQFFTRIEVLIGINLMLAGFIKCCVLLHNACEALGAVFNLDGSTPRSRAPLVAPCALLVFTGSMVIFATSEERAAWTNYTPLASVLGQVLIPVAVLAAGKIRARRKGRGGPKPARPSRARTAPQP